MRQNNLSDPQEKERILAEYAGIFPYAIKEYGELHRPLKIRNKTNFSK